MRLVNKEFENKVSAYLFKVVVVPFKPEIYGITPEPTLAGITVAQSRVNEMLQGSVMLQDKGMRVFQGFGRHIRKFAMSFEFDEARLANPPVKSDQEAITTFWGIYRWPFKKYNRYSQLEGLEQTADETRTMAKALRFIGNASELGLSIDGGLGWLAGPDINQRVIERGGKVAVFGESNFVPEPKPKIPKILRSLRVPSSSGGLDGGQHAVLLRMVQAAGAEDPETAVRSLLENEDPTGASFSNQYQFNGFAPSLDMDAFTNHPIRSSQTLLDTNLYADAVVDAGDLSPATQAEFDEDEDDEEDDENGTHLVIAACNVGRGKTECSLKPNDLTNAQKEMLLEIEWAQRAFMQSYVIAIIDNPLTFKNIETLTIARLPNRHLPILRREDFWDSLPQLNKLSLAVIPDWRDVVKLPTSWVQDIKLAPSKSVAGVCKILQDHISQRKNIKTVHFEWICGGEEAPGLFARNQHILAAPLVCKPMEMVNRPHPSYMLSLPYVEHLSLKNCWISPHMLARFGLSLKKCALQSLTLDSVSLTASLALNAQPNPLTHGANNYAAQLAAANHLQIIQGWGQNGHAPQVPLAPPAGNPNPTPDWLDSPRVGSWADIIETLTPSVTLADIRYARDIGPQPPARNPSNLKKLVFKSCGYVRLPLDFDQTALEPNEIPPQINTIAKRINDLDQFMMKPHDHTLGTIVNHISAVESRTLENAWNMTIGWQGKSRSVLLLEALADGVLNAGQGRFDGVIEARCQQSANRSSQ
jgi:hypothetical protein